MSAEMIFLLIKLCTFQLSLTAKGAAAASPASCRNLPRQVHNPTYRCVLAASTAGWSFTDLAALPLLSCGHFYKL